MKRLLLLLLFLSSFVYANLTHDTPRRVADTNNNIIWSWESKPFGEDKPTGTFTLNLRFPGQYYDSETNTHYNINRDYNPLTGRYIQSDPIGFCGGTNTYTYVENNPISKYDKYGLLSCKACLKGCETNIEALYRKIPIPQAKRACWAAVFVGETACKGYAIFIFVIKRLL